MATAVISPRLVKGNPVGLRSVGIDEVYLEKFIDADPTVLGLGDVFVVERQRHQDAGRLDLLLQDTSDEVRYEVELMLGKIDASHLIRTIEYWDIERRRYPAYDHKAIVIAEDITTRFLNVITLFSGSIPIIAMQVNAFQVDHQTAITFLKVADATKLREDDLAGSAKLKSTDRAEWITRVGTGMVELADKCLQFINEAAKRQRTLNYNKQFIGLADGARSNNFVSFKPLKSVFRLSANLDPLDPWTSRLKEAELDFRTKNGRIKIDFTPKDFDQNRELLREILHEAVTEDEKE